MSGPTEPDDRSSLLAAGSEAIQDSDVAHPFAVEGVDDEYDICNAAHGPPIKLRPKLVTICNRKPLAAAPEKFPATGHRPCEYLVHARRLRPAQPAVGPPSPKAGATSDLSNVVATPLPGHRWANALKGLGAPCPASFSWRRWFPSARGRQLGRWALGHLDGLGIFLVDRLRANASPGGDPRPTVTSLA